MGSWTAMQRDGAGLIELLGLLTGDTGGESGGWMNGFSAADGCIEFGNVAWLNVSNGAGSGGDIRLLMSQGFLKPIAMGLDVAVVRIFRMSFFGVVGRRVAAEGECWLVAAWSGSNARIATESVGLSAILHMIV
jgi:hypothetical protein